MTWIDTLRAQTLAEEAGAEPIAYTLEQFAADLAELTAEILNGHATPNSRAALARMQDPRYVVTFTEAQLRATQEE